MKSDKIIWIAWEKHRRTLELCKYLNITLYILESNLHRAVRHPTNFFKTMLIINRKRPKILFVQNPSILLAVLACCLRSIYGYKIIADSHNGAIVPEGFIMKIFLFLYNYVQKKADMTIVTNKRLAEIVTGNGGNPFVLPDKIPEPPPLEKKLLKGKYNFVYICTFGRDEPYEDVISAVQNLDTDIMIYITGNFRKCDPQIRNLSSENLLFMGFISDQDYWNLLYSADFSIDLTKRENCLVCGAYEAVAVGTPMLLSDTKELRSYFSKGAVYTDNTDESICSAIKIGISRQAELRREIEELRNQLISDWNQKGSKLSEIVKRLSSQLPLK